MDTINNDSMQTTINPPIKKIKKSFEVNDKLQCSFNSNDNNSKISETLAATMDSILKPNNDDRYVDIKALQLMEKMGYKKGTGLGKCNQGRTDPVEIVSQIGRKGFGLSTKKLDIAATEWDPSLEQVNAKEDISWISSSCDKILTLDILKSWTVIGERKITVNTESEFINSNTLIELLASKDLLDLLEPVELCKARSRANPFETIKGVFFLNRAAVKMANIDAACDFLFTNIENDPYHKCLNKPYYFADVCAGPGGFSEYILWRKQWLYKGFGFTLRGENDFRLDDFYAAPTETFQTLYGAQGDGNIYDPSNILDFKEKVLLQTDRLGVHFMMADGGFSVDGNENLQEILSKQIYLCQCLVALSIVRTAGYFVTKVFDLFTPFSTGLIYLMYLCFENVSIFKPNSSRPANSERYFICKNKKADTEVIREYLEDVNKKIWNLGSESEMDINELVPLEIICKDTNFFKYIVESNDSIANRQTVNLKKIIAFSKNLQLVETRQSELRSQCLAYWNLPDEIRTKPIKKTPYELISLLIQNNAFMNDRPKIISVRKDFENYIENYDDWIFSFNGSTQNNIKCHFYLSMGGTRVYVYNNKNWMLMTSNIVLPFGTLIYAEEIMEIEMKSDKKQQVPTLHIIDACFLGEVNLLNKPFSERLIMIEIFCTAVNNPFRTDLIRIRIKPILLLNQFRHMKSLVSYIKNKKSQNLAYMLSTKKNQESYFIIKSIIFLKKNPDDIFEKTFTSNVLWNIQLMNSEKHAGIDNDSVTWNNIFDLFSK